MLICNHQHDFFGRKTETLISYTGVVLAEHPEWTGFLCYTLQNFNEGHGEDFLLHKKLLLWWTFSTLHSQYLGVFSGSFSLHWNEEICTEKNKHSRQCLWFHSSNSFFQKKAGGGFHKDSREDACMLLFVCWKEISASKLLIDLWACAGAHQSYSSFPGVS